MLDRKSELDLVETASKANKIIGQYGIRMSRLSNAETNVDRYLTTAFNTVESLTEGLHKNTKLKVFENYLFLHNSYSLDSYESAMEDVRYYNKLIQESQLKAVLNPLVTENMEFDSEKFSALKTLITKA